MNDLLVRMLHHSHVHVVSDREDHCWLGYLFLSDGVVDAGRRMIQEQWVTVECESQDFHGPHSRSNPEKPDFYAETTRDVEDGPGEDDDHDGEDDLAQDPDEDMQDLFGEDADNKLDE